MGEELYDEDFWAYQRKLLKEEDKFISLDECWGKKRND